MPKGYASGLGSNDAAGEEDTVVDIGPPTRPHWYARLPSTAHRDLQARRREKAWRRQQRAKLARHSLARAMVQACVPLVATELAFAPPSPIRRIATLVAGMIVGYVWFRFAAGRFLCPFAAVAAWFAVHLAFRGGPMGNTSMVSGFATLVLMCALVGLVRERRRVDGQDY